MRIYQEVMFPETRHVSTVCDNPGCGRVTRYADDWESRDMLNHYDRITVARTRGTRYPTGGDGVITRFDLCPDCYEALVVKPLQALGIVPHTEEIES